MQDAINDKTIAIGVKTGKLTATALNKAIQAVLAELKKASADLTHPEPKRGKQTLKQLAAKDAGVSSIELTNPDLRLLNKIMRENGVDFAPVKNGKDSYLLFFKGRDADAITHAFEKYTQKMVKQADRPSIKKTLFKHREEAKKNQKQRAKTKNKDRGQSL